jgi:hypothetical protein
MDNSNAISKSLLQSDNNSVGSVFSGSAESSSNSSNSFFSFFQNITATTWILIIIGLAFLGINIFAVLAKGTQDVTSIFQPLVDLFARLTGQIVTVTAQGAKDVVNTSACVVDAGLTGVQNVAQGQGPLQGPTQQPVSSATPTTTSGTPVQATNVPLEPTQVIGINKILNKSVQQSQGTNGQTYEADVASSSIQSGGLGKAGWCYIGEDSGYRTCAQVGVNDSCMSGEIFPSQEICINPSLRS